MATPSRRAVAILGRKVIYPAAISTPYQEARVTRRRTRANMAKRIVVVTEGPANARLSGRIAPRVNTTNRQKRTPGPFHTACPAQSGALAAIMKSATQRIARVSIDARVAADTMVE